MKKFSFFWILVLSLSACGVFKSAPDRRNTPKPPTEEREEVKEIEDRPAKEDQLDTVEVGKLDPDTSRAEVDTPLLKEEEYNRKAQYNIRLLLPLLPLEKSVEVSDEETGAEKEKSLTTWNLSFMEYLAGLKLGFTTFQDTVAEFSYRLSVTTSEDMDQIITNSDDNLGFKNVDIVLGGVTRNSLEKLSSWSAQQDKVYISPWVPFSPLSENTNYIQLSPGLEKHCNALTAFLMQEYKYENIFIVSTKENDDKIDCFNEYFREKGVSTRFKQILFSDQFELEELEKLADIFNENDTNIIIIPESRNKAFIHRVISRLSVLDDLKFKIVGLPGWLKYDLLYNYFEKMPFILSVDQFVSKDSVDYQAFEKRYFERYHALPSDWSVKGFDQAMFIAKGLHTFGLDMTDNLEDLQHSGIGVHIYFEPKQGEQSPKRSLYDNVNKEVQIIEYKKHQFQKVSP